MRRRRLNGPVAVPPLISGRVDFPPELEEERRQRTSVWCPVRYEPSCGACTFWMAAVFTESPWIRSVDGGPWELTEETSRSSGTESFGRCRRHAPDATRDRLDLGGRQVWPQTEADDWCGDFEPRNVYVSLASGGEPV